MSHQNVSSTCLFNMCPELSVIFVLSALSVLFVLSVLSVRGSSFQPSWTTNPNSWALTLFLPWPRSEGSAMTINYPFFLLVVVVLGFQA